MSKEKLVPKLRFEEFLGNKYWSKKELNEVALYRNGKAHENDIADEGSFIVVNSKFVSTNGSVKKYTNNQNEPLFKDEIAFVLSDVPNGRAIARTYLITKNNKYTLNQRIAGITPNQNINSYFLYNLMNRNPYFLKFDDGVKQTNLSKADVNNFYSFYPIKEEQNKIGSFLKNIDELIQLQQSKVNKVKYLKSAYLSEMFPKEGEKYPKKRFEGFTEPWTAKKLGSLLDYEQPTNYLVKSDSYDDSYLTPVLTAGKSFLLGYTNETEGIYKADNNNGVIIFDDFTTSSHFVDFDFKVKSSAMKFLRTNQSNFNLYFLYNLLTSIHYSPESHERHWISIFSEFEVLVPTKKEQEKIAQLFKNLDNQISIEEKKLAKLENLKQGYLNDMFV